MTEKRDDYLMLISSMLNEMEAGTINYQQVKFYSEDVSLQRLQLYFQANNNEFFQYKNIMVHNSTTRVRMKCMDEEIIDLGTSSFRGLKGEIIASSMEDAEIRRNLGVGCWAFHFH